MRKLNQRIFEASTIVASIIVSTLCIARAGAGAEEKETEAVVEPTRTLVHDGQVLSMSYSPDGKLLATGSVNSRVRLWDLGTSQVKLALSLRTGQATTGGG